MSEYIRKYKDSNDIIPFNVSDDYIVNFKNRHKISIKKCHVKRRTDKNFFVNNFLKTVEDLKENEDNDYIINIDETSWEVFPKSILIWQEKGKIPFLHILIRLTQKHVSQPLQEYLHLEQSFQ